MQIIIHSFLFHRDKLQLYIQYSVLCGIGHVPKQPFLIAAYYVQMYCSYTEEKKKSSVAHNAFHNGLFLKKTSCYKSCNRISV